MNGGTRGSPAVVVRAASAVSVAALLVFCVFVAREFAIRVPILHLDGAFQTASGLYRLDAGQAPGRDFLPYLGVGPLYLLYPLFEWCGANLGASVFTAQFMTMVFVMGYTAILWYLCSGTRPGWRAVVLGCASYVGLVVMAKGLGFAWDHPLRIFASPGNSLKPIRAAAPYGVAIGYYLVSRHVVARPLRHVLYGAICGVALLWSNDFALPSVGLFLVCIGAFADRGERHSRKSVLVVAGVAAAVWLALLSLATRGHAPEMLRYNFVDVARDQWWYFGPYDEEHRIFGPADAARMLSWRTGAALAVFAAVVLAWWRGRTLRLALLAWIGLVLLAGGVLPSVGGHLGEYFTAFEYWAHIVLLAWAGGRLWRLSVAALPAAWADRAPAALALAVALSSCVAAGYSVRQYRSGLARVAGDTAGMFHVPELGGYLSKDWAAYIAAARDGAAGTRVVEEYWGLWSAVRRSFAPWPVDSTIHALGRVRAVAARSFAGSDLLVTTRARLQAGFADGRTAKVLRDYDEALREWQPWNLSQAFWLYGELLERWEPHAVSPTTVVWKKSAVPRTGQPVACRVQDDRRQGVTVEAPGAGFYRVSVAYRFSGSRRHLLLLRNGISFAMNAGGRVSLDPSATAAEFPVYLNAAGVHRLDAQVLGGGAASALAFGGCAARSIPLAGTPAARSLYPEVLPVPDR